MVTEFLVIVPDFSFIHLNKPGNGFQQYRFPGTAAANDQVAFSLFKLDDSHH